jgi:protein-disulfide isomerase-like protein with CxxC motif
LNRVLRMCLNWKVLGGLAVVGVGIWLVAPDLLARAFPLLILAVCPLSMLLMMGGMHRGEREARRPQAAGSSVSGDGDRVAELKGQLASVQAQQDAIAREIEQLQSRRMIEGASDAHAQAPELPNTVG